MARHYGKMSCEIWRNDDYLALSINAMFVYQMLVEQPEVTSAGTLAITLKRWTNHFTGRVDVVAAIKELAEVEAQFVVVDWDTEELLIRTFVKHDGGATNDNRVKAMKECAKAIRSAEIVTAIALELDKLGIQHDLPKSTRRPFEAHSKGVETAPEVAPEAVRSTPVMVTLVEQPEPLASSRNLYPPAEILPPPDGGEVGEAKPRSKFVVKYEPSFDEFWTIYPRKKEKPLAHKKWDEVCRAGVPPATLIAAAKRYAVEMQGKDPSYIVYPERWLGRERWDDEPDAPSPPVKTLHQQATDDMFEGYAKRKGLIA